MHCGGVVLCGGKSSRMGFPKAMLPFGPERMLERVVRILSETVQPIVVVAAPQQELPTLEDQVAVVRDRREGRGPLEGLAAGLTAMQENAISADAIEAAYATSCDVPLLTGAFVRRMLELAEGHDIAVPYVGGFHHPLAAVYKTSMLPAIERLLAQDRLRPVFLFEEARTRMVTEDELREVDPQLNSLRNLNHPADYLDALRVAGYSTPADILAQLGVEPAGERGASAP
jgi:molybdopterin-guanine dinucleotide biosynthesis protein A